MVVNCVIEFDQNPYGTYFAGQVLTGRITLQSDKAKQVKGVALKINGFAHTSWSESKSHTTHENGQTKTHSHTQHYSGHEDYLASTTYLLGSDQSQTVIIEPGVHTYNFACHLPLSCPSSFEGLHGHIRYIVKVVMARPWKFDQTFTRGFTVLTIKDLNYDSPLLRMPAAAEVHKTFCCGPCRSEPLKLNVSLPQAGYVPGQNIPVTVLLSNDSNVDVIEVKVELAMLVCYYSQLPTETTSQRMVVSKMKGEGLLRHTNKHYTYNLPVPATPPTCFNLCRIIQIAYQVEVEAKVKSPHRDQKVSVPVTIGNVPLMGVIQQQPTTSAGLQRGLLDVATLEGAKEPSSGGNQDNGLKSVEIHAVPTTNEDGVNGSESWMPTPSPPTPWVGDPNIPPPNYEEAVHMQRAKLSGEEEHDYGEREFAPRYPVFNVPSPTAPYPDEVDGGGGFVNGDPNKSTWL